MEQLPWILFTMEQLPWQRSWFDAIIPLEVTRVKHVGLPFLQTRTGCSLGVPERRADKEAFLGPSRT